MYGWFKIISQPSGIDFAMITLKDASSLWLKTSSIACASFCERHGRAGGDVHLAA